jgi:hypothetical protein
MSEREAREVEHHELSEHLRAPFTGLDPVRKRLYGTQEQLEAAERGITGETALEARVAKLERGEPEKRTFAENIVPAAVADHDSAHYVHRDVKGSGVPGHTEQIRKSD